MFFTKITQKQWILIAIIICATAIDLAITLYGAWFQTSNFYEANPLFGMIGLLNSIWTFTIGLILIKFIGIALVIYIISVCNSIGENWGDATCYGGVIFTVGVIGTLIGFNLWYLYFY
jgi:hypothetical protein